MRPLLAEVATDHLAFVYDRVNIGRSGPASTPRTAVGIVAKLHALPVTAGVPGPHVLVGQ
jgi:hypothetical protein